MTKKNIQSCLIIIAIFLFGPTPSVGAFSLGSIDFKSNFGERFLAEIELKAGNEGDLEVAIGTQEDYDRLQLERLAIVDKLRIDQMTKVGSGKETIRIVSDIPLFFPSFNLVIRASQDGGILLENYLIAVDFQKSVSLSAPRPKPNNRAFPQKNLLNGPVNQMKEVQSVKHQGIKEKLKARSIRKSNPIKKPKKIVIARNREPLNLNLAAKTPKSVTPVNSSSKLQGISSLTAGSPLPVIVPSQRLASTRHDAIVGVPKVIFRSDSGLPKLKGTHQSVLQIPIQSSKKDSEAGNSVIGFSPAKLLGSNIVYGPLAEGETLLKIANKLNADAVIKPQVTVAIWLDNLDQFIGGNIHGIKRGAVLNLGNLRKRLQQLSRHTAHLILLNHWQEWKIIKTKLSGLIEEETDSLGQGINLPAVNIFDKTAIFRLLEEWRLSWEKRDIARHMACFSKWFSVMRVGGHDLDYADWKKFKQKMFLRHGPSLIRVYRPKLILMGDRVLVSFDQTFESKTLQSFGHKVLELVREPNGWKVVSEQFRLKSTHEKGNLSRFVVHSSSHSNVADARVMVNQLREQGINAYFSPLNLTREKKIYRVFVERFSEWNLAVRMARSLRSWKFGRYAIPAPIPFSLLAGSFGLEDQASKRVEFLRKNGISAFLFSTSNQDFSNPVFNVMVGAYSREKETQESKRQLAKLGIPFRLIAS